MSGTGDLRAAMVARIEALVALSQSEAFGVHRLFAGLYVQTNRHLLAHFDTLPEPDFAYLAMTHFYDLYDRYIVQPVLGGGRATVTQWRRYAGLAARLTMASATGAHLRLLSLGARAHVGHDLGEAILLAIPDYRRLHGRDPDLDAAYDALLGKPTGDAFYAATLEYNAVHRRQQCGWRHTQLVFHAVVARISKPIWLAVLQSWRRAAWRAAMAAHSARQPAGARRVIWSRPPQPR